MRYGNPGQPPGGLWQQVQVDRAVGACLLAAGFAALRLRSGWGNGSEYDVPPAMAQRP